MVLLNNHFPVLFFFIKKTDTPEGSRNVLNVMTVKRGMVLIESNKINGNWTDIVV